MSMRILALLCLLVLPGMVSAHGTGASHESVVDGYLIDIGYSASEPTVGESVQFDFALTKEGSTVPYDDVWVRIEDEAGNILLATGLYNSEYGGPRLTYRFSEAGTYTVNARYEQGSTPLVERSFSISVGGTNNQTHENESQLPLIPLGIGLVVGVVSTISVFWLRRRM